MFLQEKFVIFALIGLLETHLQDDYNTTQTIFMSLRLQSCVLQCQACPVWGCHKMSTVPVFFYWGARLSVNDCVPLTS